MKNKNRPSVHSFVVGFILVALAVIDWHDQSTTTPPTSVTQSAPRGPLNVRKEIHDTWLTSLDQLSARSGDPELLEIRDFVRSHAVLAEPIPGDVRLLSTAPKQDPWFSFVPMIETDETLGDPWQAFATQPFMGSYVPYQRVMIVKDFLIAPLWRGLVFAHEGWHAKRHLTGQTQKNGDWQHCLEEVGAHSFENRVARSIGGTPYAEYIRQELKRIDAELTRVNATIQQAFPNPPTVYDFRLDQAFGQALSDTDRENRIFNASVDAMFQYIDMNWRIPHNEKHGQKAAILCTMYRKNGIL
ncbi:MAG: hypothetical protein Q7N87_01020 [Candidatus Uhrbacteria bacterium]|nr:hypothetical protein [Candidatus Uhrbacteria bacterium]MDP3793238.1 hypothetical protein [Candidatus Uhrbacteria bacterium]